MMEVILGSMGAGQDLMDGKVFVIGSAAQRQWDTDF